MQDLEALKEYYRHGMGQAVAKFESFRRKKIAYVLIFGLFLLGVSATVFITGRSGGNGFMGGVLLIISVPLFSFVAYRAWKDYRLAYKRELITPLINQMAPQTTYSPEAHVPEQQFLNSGLFSTRGYSRFTGEDLVQGTLHGIEMQFSELHVTRSGKESDVVIFRGLFLVAYVNSPIEGSVKVIPDLGTVLPDNAVGRMLRSLIERYRPMPAGHLVKTGNEAFDRTFQVISQEESEATAVITRDLQKAILELQEIAQHTVRVAFEKDCIYIALDVTDDLFEIPFLKTVKSYDIVHRFVGDLQRALRVVELVSTQTNSG